ncbi:MAG: acyl-CoA dehydrogenase family protein [Myxococcales bacterium]|nr:acyl-CoA dehydrogenase family protein [Myxococcales bacterium]
MDFSLSEEDLLLRDTVRELCDQQVRPHAGAWDEARALPPELLPGLGQQGLLAMERPEDEGGAGLSTVAATSLVEELAAADGALALLVSVHNHLGLAHAAQGLRPGPRAQELPALTDGRHIAAWALSERGSGSDALRLSTSARRDGDGWVLQGEKRYVLGASVAQRIVVLATTAGAGKDGPERSRPEEVVALLVDADAPGLERSEPVRTLGMRAAGTAHLRLDGVRVPAERELGDPGRAWADAMALLDRSRVGMAAVACGIGRGAMEVAAAYAQEREQFGRPIAEFQAIQWKLADMATTLEAAWLLTLQAAWRRDVGLPFGAHASRAKLAAARAATVACSEALQIHGGYGYTREFPVERALRDARLCEIGEGTNEIQRLLISRAIAERFAA